jgi:hypothetical protein
MRSDITSVNSGKRSEVQCFCLLYDEVIMGTKRVYTCDICRSEKSPGQLIGCNFTNMTQFKLATVYSTDGVHICKDCLKQLKEQIPNVGI